MFGKNGFLAKKKKAADKSLTSFLENICKVVFDYFCQAFPLFSLQFTSVSAHLELILAVLVSSYEKSFKCTWCPIKK